MKDHVQNLTFQTIANFVLGDASNIPDTALEMAALLLVDTVGITAGAINLDAGRIARDFAVDFYAAGKSENEAGIMFDDRKASLAGAAFAAATQTDNLDGHDGYNPTKGHIGCAIFPALFAIAQQKPDLTAREALEAVVIAYEVSARAAIALHATVSDYHTSGAWNAVGTAALTCRLLGSSTDTLRQAMGIAEYHGPRSQMMREIDNPSMLHDGSGMGAFVGVSAALMAERGFTGAPAVTAEYADASEHWDDLGDLWTIELNYIKPYPICRWAHAAIDAVRSLKIKHDLRPQDIATVEVNTFAQAARLYPYMPSTTSQAQYSLPFPVAVMLLHGHIGPNHVSGKMLQDPAIAAFLPKIVVKETERHSKRFPIGRWSDVTITLNDGSKLNSGDVHARGGPEAPMSIDEIADKFMHMARENLSESRATAIWEMRKRLLHPKAMFSEFNPLVYHSPDRKTSCKTG